VHNGVSTLVKIGRLRSSEYVEKWDGAGAVENTALACAERSPDDEVAALV
jgi:hypothetical protein